MNKKLEETFSWFEFDENLRDAFCKLFKMVEDLFRGLMELGLPNHALTGRSRGLMGLGLPNHSLTGRSLQKTDGAWVTKPFTNWKISSEDWWGLDYQTIH